MQRRVAIAILLAACGSSDTSDKPQSKNIDALGSRLDGAAPASIDDARKLVISGAKIREEQKLPTGGFYFLSDVEFPTGKGEPPMLLPYVTTFAAGRSGVIQCQAQLQNGDDPAPFAAVCKSPKPI